MFSGVKIGGKAVTTGAAPAAAPTAPAASASGSGSAAPASASAAAAAAKDRDEWRSFGATVLASSSSATGAAPRPAARGPSTEMLTSTGLVAGLRVMNSSNGTTASASSSSSSSSSSSLSGTVGDGGASWRARLQRRERERAQEQERDGLSHGSSQQTTHQPQQQQTGALATAAGRVFGTVAAAPRAAAAAQSAHFSGLAEKDVYEGVRDKMARRAAGGGNDRDHDREQQRGGDRARDRTDRDDRDRERARERSGRSDRDRDYDRNRDRDRDSGRERTSDRDRERDSHRDRDSQREHERGSDRISAPAAPAGPSAAEAAALAAEAALRERVIANERWERLRGPAVAPDRDVFGTGAHARASNSNALANTAIASAQASANATVSEMSDDAPPPALASAYTGEPAAAAVAAAVAPPSPERVSRAVAKALKARLRGDPAAAELQAKADALQVLVEQAATAAATAAAAPLAATATAAVTAAPAVSAAADDALAGDARVLDSLDSRGRARGVTQEGLSRVAVVPHGQRNSRAQLVDKETGERRGYFGSDAAAAGAAPVSLATALTDLVRKERLGTDDFSDAAWLRAAAKNKLALEGSLDDQWDALDNGAADPTLSRSHRPSGTGSRVRTVEEAQHAEARARGRALAAQEKAAAHRARCVLCRAVGDYTGFNKDHQRYLAANNNSGSGNNVNWSDPVVVSVGVKAYLALPAQRWVVPGHCLIAPLEHTGPAAAFDAELAEEVAYFQKLLAKAYGKLGQGVVFFETVQRRANGGSLASAAGGGGAPVTGRSIFGAGAFGGSDADAVASNASSGGGDGDYHTVIECVPVPRRDFLAAPSVFRQALLDSDEQWASHKGVIDTAQRGVKTLPASAAFSYFHVQFGPDPPKGHAGGSGVNSEGDETVRVPTAGPFAAGLGHIIEDRAQFPAGFGAQTLCAVMELDSIEALRPRREDARGRAARLEAFKAVWHKHDWTRKLNR